MFNAVHPNAIKEYGPIVQPIFISVDPARDSVAQVARYVGDFHPRLVGLTGDYATLKATCKAYRVYFSTPPDAKATDDYLVDHSIFFYFMDPDGRFVDAFGKASSEGDVVERVKKEIARWEGERGIWWCAQPERKHAQSSGQHRRVLRLRKPQTRGL